MGFRNFKLGVCSAVAAIATISSVQAQQKVTLSGYVKDVATGETILGAAIYVKETQSGITSNNYGFYSLSLPPGTYTVRVSAMGYDEWEQQVELSQTKTLDIEFGKPDAVTGIGSKKSTALNEVTIYAERPDKNVTSTQMGQISLSAEKIKKLPAFFGEADVLKAIQLMPGVQSSGEGQAGFYVRGGGPDQNLVLLDEAVVYNTGHLFGFFSIFNSDAIKNANLIKGGASAEYGGRLSSVLDVTMKDGNQKEFHGEGGIGLIASRLSFEGPIVKNKGSFIVSARRTYIDALTKPFIKGDLKGSGYYFYDANIKANYKITPKDRIYLSTYLGQDKFTFKNADGFNLDMPWGNQTATLRWNHQFNSKLFMNLSGIYNRYKFEFAGGSEDATISLNSGIKDWGGKLDFDYYSSFNHNFKFGANYTYHTITPNQYGGTSEGQLLTVDNPFTKFGHELALYALDEFDVGEKVKINAGLRYSGFAQVGPYKWVTQDANGNVLNTADYEKGDLVKYYGGLEPRLSGRFTLSNSASIKAAVAKSYQYLHLVSNNGSTLPTDVWMPSTGVLAPQRAWQYSVGYFKNWFDNALETSVEVYYKDLKQQYEYREGYTPSSTADPELDIVTGIGNAYGAEFFINKKLGKFTGWIGYTLSWTYRKFDLLNEGERFPAKYDRRNDLSIVANYEFNKKWNASAVFVYGSGNAITLPTSMYILDGRIVQDNSKINQYRIFPYHRLDLSVNYTPRPESKKRFKSTWNFALYNTYSRMNPYILYLSNEGSFAGGSQFKVKQISIFPILPSVTWNFKF